MTAERHIRNPFEYGLEQAAAALAEVTQAFGVRRAPPAVRPILSIRKIDATDLWDALTEAAGDLAAYRTDVVFLGLIYPLAGLILARLAYGHGFLPLIFPLASGFALIGPLTAVGLYEISRRREAGETVPWSDALGVLRSPAIVSIGLLGLVLVALFLAWLGAAWGIYLATLGPAPPASLGGFLREVFATGAGWMMIAAGLGVGFVFAVIALAISVVSFPLLVDRRVGVMEAVALSVRAVLVNPRPMALWGLIVAGGLVLGGLPALAGLIVVIPLLGHATWRLYRKLVSASYPRPRAVRRAPSPRPAERG